METDSFFCARSRDPSAFESIQAATLCQNQASIPFKESILGQNQAAILIRIFGRMLDYSSFTHGTLYDCFVGKSAKRRAMIKYLALTTKNEPFRLKFENDGCLIAGIFSPSSKQHVILAHEENETYPRYSNPIRPLIKKIRGLPRSYHKDVTVTDFQNVACDDIPAQKILQARLARSGWAIHLTQGSRKTLTRGGFKRIVVRNTKNNFTFFNFPIFWKNIIESCL